MPPRRAAPALAPNACVSATAAQMSSISGVSAIRLPVPDDVRPVEARRLLWNAAVRTLGAWRSRAPHTHAHMLKPGVEWSPGAAVADGPIRLRSRESQHRAVTTHRLFDLVKGGWALPPPPPLPPHTHPPPPATLPVLSRSFRLPPSCRCPARARSRTRSPDHSRVARSGRPSARASCSAAHAQPFAFRRVCAAPWPALQFTTCC